MDCELGIVLRALYANLNYSNSLMKDILLSPYFIDEHTGAQRELLTQSHIASKGIRSSQLTLDSEQMTTVGRCSAWHLPYGTCSKDMSQNYIGFSISMQYWLGPEVPLIPLSCNYPLVVT